MRALIVVDVQNDFCPGGRLPVPDGHQCIPEINRLAKAYHLVVLTQDWHPPTHSSFKPYGGPWDRHCMQGYNGAEINRHVNIPQAELIIRKGCDERYDSYSAFCDEGGRATGLKGYLSARWVTEVDVVGLALDYCVKATALDAHLAGFKTRVLLAGCRGMAQSSIDEALAEMKDVGVEIVP